MAKLVWDATGERKYEMGVSKGVLYPYSEEASTLAEPGVAWNGLTAVNENPEGAEATDLYADNAKYTSFRSAEKLNGTIEAYMYPDEFNACDGADEMAPGMVIRQQSRKSFGMCWRTEIGDDVKSDRGYKIHIMYGASVSPSDRSWDTINESPDANTFSWDFATTPVPVEGYKPTSKIEIDSTKVSAEKMAALLDKLYGTESTEPELLTPEAVYAIIK